jgi:hypothetical protein
MLNFLQLFFKHLVQQIEIHDSYSSFAAGPVALLCHALSTNEKLPKFRWINLSFLGRLDLEKGIHTIPFFHTPVFI